MIVTALTCACADIFGDKISAGGETLNYTCAAKTADTEA